MQRVKGVYIKVILVSASIISGSVLASGFSILEQNAADIGKANSGTGVESDNAASQFSNAATLAFEDGTNVSLVGTAINNNTSFHNVDSQPAFGQQLGNTGGNDGHTHFVPADYMSKRLNDQWVVGLGINSPFGLAIDYTDNALARFQARHSSVKTVNVNPNIAFRMTPRVSVGFGISYQKIESELTSNINYSAVIAGALPGLVQSNVIPASAIPGIVGATTDLSGMSTIRGDDHGLGFNVGMLYKSDSDAWKLGLAYRSGIRYTIKGTAEFTAPTTSNPVGALIVESAMGTGGPLANGGVSLNLNLPASALLSSDIAITKSWHMVADLLWTQWSKIQQLAIVRNTGTTLSTTPEQWKDTLRVSLGQELQLNEKWLLRAGIAYDETPVPNDTRNPRLPDNARQWIALGTSWKMSERYSFDFAYALVNENKAGMNVDGGNSQLYGIVNGYQQTRVNIVSAQLNGKF